MPNIKQQKKRVRTAAEERLENLRYRSTIKTLAKRLSASVEEGDATTIAAEHKNLVQWVDRAVTRGALHRNAAARKKSQAARLAATVGTVEVGTPEGKAAPAAKAGSAKAASPKKAAPGKAAPAKAARKPAAKKK
jgi:small subunit ribosomal protein S20